MKTIILSLIGLFALTSCKNAGAKENQVEVKEVTTTQQLKEENKMGKTLIVFYSRRGQNYFGGDIKDLKVGNTEKVANKIKEITGGDIFEIKTVNEYPKDYTECTNVAKDELRQNARPEIVGGVNIDDYDTIYLGYPNWWGTMPMCVWTFIENHKNLAGKTIYPFCTNEGSGFGRSIKDIEILCPEATVKEGIAIIGSQVDNSGSRIENWLKK